MKICAGEMALDIRERTEQLLTSVKKDSLREDIVEQYMATHNIPPVAMWSMKEGWEDLAMYVITIRWYEITLPDDFQVLE